MGVHRTVWSVIFAAGAMGSMQPLAAGTTTIIMKGKVVMIDGSVPPKQVGIQRVCSDAGSARGTSCRQAGELRLVASAGSDDAAGLLPGSATGGIQFLAV